LLSDESTINPAQFKKVDGSTPAFIGMLDDVPYMPDDPRWEEEDE
jgi:hypothetical protein